MQRTETLSHIGRMDQLASIRRYVLDDGKGRGMRALEVSNSSGFAFTVYPDRGLDIGPATYNGKSLVWLARNGAVHPAFYDQSGAEWLRTSQGGLLMTCGWINVGNPCNASGEAQGLHGRMHHTPAEEVNTRAYWNDADEYVLEVTGKIVHSRVFAENLVTSRTIVTRYGHAGLELFDRTENVGATTQPLMQLYHMNFGWPLISEKTELRAAPHTVTPRDVAAESGLAVWRTMPAPDPDFAEQVMYHDLPADAEGFASIDIASPDFGPETVRLSYRKAELPYLVQWRQAGVGDYVMGLEPGNCYPVGQESFAKTGLLRRIEPGQIVETRLRVEVLQTDGTTKE